MEMLLERFEQRVLLQAPSARFLKTPERLAAIGLRREMEQAEMPIKPLQQWKLELRDRRIIDELRILHGVQRVLECLGADRREHVGRFERVRNGRDIDVQHVEKQPRGRAVRARVRRVVRKERVQRVEPDHAGAAPAPLCDERAQIGEIAHAPAALRAQRIQLHGRAPHAPAVFQRRRHVTAARSHDERDEGVRLQAGTLQLVAVVAARKALVPVERDFAIRVRADRVPPQRFELLGTEGARVHLTVFELEAPLVGGPHVRFAEAKAHAVGGRVDPEDGDRRHDTVPGFALVGVERTLQVVIAIQNAQRFQHRAARAVGGPMCFSPDVVVFARYAVDAA